MSSRILTRLAFQPARRVTGGYGRLQRRWVATEEVAASQSEEGGKSQGQRLQKSAKRDPELYILLAVMSCAFGLAGWYFGRKPTSASSESQVPMAHGSMPWQTEGGSNDSKYQYHPGGDQSKAPKDAPSALNTVIVPNVNLPKHLHDKWNKWGKDGY
ncbi:hypothetical protein MMC10_008534 [Thelotrema lepadinum]|nr:hypothetical protein [Thelotrema lepadinum]